MNLTKVQIKYLLLVYDLRQTGYVRSCDLARIMEVTTPCVHRVLEQLVEKNVVDKKKYSKVSLTDAGSIMAMEYYPAYNAFKGFFEKSLDACSNDATRAALALASELKPESIRGMCEMMIKRHLLSGTAAG